MAVDQTNRASLALSTRAGRLKGDLETRDQTGDLPESVVLKSPLRTKLKEGASLLWKSRYL